MNNPAKHLPVLLSLLLGMMLLAACNVSPDMATPFPDPTALQPTATAATATNFPTSTALAIAPRVTAAPTVKPTSTSVILDLPTATTRPTAQATAIAQPTQSGYPIPTVQDAPGLSAAQVDEQAKSGRYFIYDISTGDTLSSVAAAFDLDVNTLARLNQLPADASLQPGRTLLVLSTLAGDFSFMPADSIRNALPGIYRVLMPNTDMLAQYDFRLALHRAKLALPASGAQPGYVLVFYTIKDSIIGQRGDEDVSIVAPAFAVAGGSLASTVSPNNAADFYTDAAGEVVKTFAAARGSAQANYQMLVGNYTPAATPTTGAQGGLSTAEVEAGAKSGRYFIYDISAGDTLPTVAAAFDLDVNTLARLNQLPADASLQPGRTLLISATLAGDLSFMPTDSIIDAVKTNDIPRIMIPGSDTLQRYDFRLALHRAKLAMPASGATAPGYILIFYTTKDSIIGEKGDEDVSVIDPAFVVAGGSLAKEVNPSGGADFYSTNASGITELVKTYRGARSSAQDLYGQIAQETR